MTDQSQEWLNNDTLLSLSELCACIDAHAEFVEDLVKHGVIEPVDSRPTVRFATSWRFSKHALDRSLKAVRLTKDLGVNIAGASLAIELWEQLDSTRAELARLRQLRGR